MSYWNMITLWFFIYFIKLFNLLQVINENVAVWDSSGKEVESQLLPLLNVSVTVRKYHVKAYLGKSPKTAPSYWLAFSATVPPLGFSTYIVSSSKWAGLPFDFCLKLVMQRGETTIVADLCYFLPLYTCRCYFCETRVQVRKQKKWYNKSRPRKIETYLFWKSRKACTIH